MITCNPDPEAGSILLSGITPNGNGLVTRTRSGETPFILRGGSAPITNGGFALTDTEAPLGVPVEYVVAVSNISSADRLVQQNLMRTPDFTRGVQSWAAGTGRTLTVVPDATAATPAAVGTVSSTATTTSPGSVPTLVGHKDTAVTVSGSYILDPATPTGGAAIANNDWMLIVHSQVSTVAAPATPTGWTLIDDVTVNGYRQLRWKRKRIAGDGSYTVAAAAGASSVGSLLWVRGAGDVQSVSPTTTGVTNTLVSPWHSSIRPALVVSTFSAVGAPYVSLSGGTLSYTATGTTRSLAVATNSQAAAGDTAAVTATYGAGLAAGFASQVAFQNADVLTNRTIAVTKADAIPATSSDQPHLLTGRFRFTHPGLWTWADVLAQGTWQNLKNTKTTWLDVRGSASTLSGEFAHLFVTIVDPATGADYIQPQQVLTALELTTNSWVGFSMLFANSSTIPSTAEIRLVHGSALKEFGINWSFDRFGLTPGANRNHDTLFWFSGDSVLPTNTAELLVGSGWTANTTDASVTWAGTPGNSTSELRTASSLKTSTICELGTPEIVPSEPVLLSDPVNAGLFLWVSLVDIGDLTRDANRALYKVLDGKYPVAVSSRRAAEAGTFVVETGTLSSRDKMNDLLDSGRVLLLRNPDPAYPESSWYVSIGNTKEARPIPDAHFSERLWSLPFARVERPTGLIEVSAGRTWADVLAEGTWANVLAENDDWLDVLDGEA